jgi:hypothetical protein
MAEKEVFPAIMAREMYAGVLLKIFLNAFCL